MKMLFAALYVLALAVPQDSPAAAGPADAPISALEVQRRPDAVGDLRVFVSETELTSYAEGGEARQVNRQKFELETLAASAEQMTLRFRLLEASLTDSRDPGLERLLQAWVGVDVVVAADASGRPVAFADWPAVREAYRTRLSELGLQQEQGDVLAAGLDRLPPEDLLSLLLSDVALLAEMQPRQPLPEGRVEQPVQNTDQVARSGVQSVARTADGCGLLLTRSFSAETPGSTGTANSMKRDTRATLHIADGWVSEVSRTTAMRAGEQRSDEVVRIRRDPAPQCPAA
nr:hypothetical protein [Brevundimonas diminuta]